MPAIRTDGTVNWTKEALAEITTIPAMLPGTWSWVEQSIASNPASGASGLPFEKGALVYNVLAYGALGNASADDTTAIQAAINASNGCAVFIPPLNFWTFAALTLPSSIHIIGVGQHYTTTSKRSRIIQQTSGVQTFKNADQVNGNDDIRIEHLWIEGIGTGGAINAVDIRGTSGKYCHGIRFIECLFDQAPQHTVYLNWVKESEIYRCFFLNAVGDAVQLDTAVDVLIQGNQVATKPATGGDGISLYNTSSNNIIVENFVFQCFHGILVSIAAGCIIALNRVNTNQREGIYLVGAGASNNSVTGNMCYDNGAGGAGTRAGITLDGACANCLVADNTCWDTGTTNQVNGIRLASTCLNNRILDNNCNGNTGAGVLNTSSGLNEIRGNAGYNPVGSVGAVSFPATTVVGAAASIDRWLYITNGTGALSIVVTGLNGNVTIAIPASAFAPLFVPAQQTWTPTYAAGVPTVVGYGV